MNVIGNTLAQPLLAGVCPSVFPGNGNGVVVMLGVDVNVAVGVDPVDGVFVGVGVGDGVEAIPISSGFTR